MVQRKHRLTALYGALLYAAIAGLWILLSDRVLLLIIHSFDVSVTLEDLSRWQTGKGLFFVAMMTVFVYVVINHYLSRQEKDAKKLRSSQKRLQAIFDNSQDAILLFDNEATCIEANAAAYRLTGYADGELIGMSLWDVIPESQLAEAHQLWQTYLADGRQEGEYVICRKDGTPIPVEYRSVANICPGVHLTIAHDIRKRKQAEIALLDSRERFRELFHAAPLPMVITRLSDGVVVEANERYAAFLDMPREKIIGRRNIETFTESPELQQLSRQVLENGHVHDHELALHRADGSTDWLLTSMRPIIYENETAILSGFQDITQRRQAMEAEREQRRMAEALRDNAAAIHRTLDLDKILDRILSNIAEVIEYDAANVILLEKGRAYYLGGQGHRQKSMSGVPGRRMLSDIETSGLYTALTKEQPFLVQDTTAYDEWPQVPRLTWFRSYLSAPLKVHGNVIGLLNLIGIEPKKFTEEQAQNLVAFADQAATAIQNARLFEESQRRASELEALRHITLNISRQLDLSELLPDLISSALELLNAEGGGLYLYQPNEDQLEWIVSAGPVKLSWPLLHKGEGLSGRIWEGGKPLSVNHYAEWDGALPPGKEARVGAMIGVPIRWKEEFLGVLVAYVMEQTPRTFSEHDEELLSQFADQAAIALKNAQLYSRLSNYSQELQQAVSDATQELREEKERVEAILDNSPEAILLLTWGGKIESANPAFEQLFRRPASSLTGHSPTELISSDDVPGMEHAFQQLVKEQTPQRLTATAVRTDGVSIDADIALAPIVDADRLVGVVCSFHDITEMKEVQRAKDAFISTASHEFRTPLTSIRGFSEMLLNRDMKDDRKHRYYEIINEQAKILGDIIEDMLDLTRLQAERRLHMKFGPVDIKELIRQEIQPFVETTPNHTFDISELEDTPVIWGDRFRLAQVMRNLLSNAVKYSPEGGPVILRSTVNEDKVAITVQDEGIGMTPDEQRQAFDKFYRADTSNTAVGGTGLGLAIAKLIVERHGGDIWIESEPGAGSTFTFTVPIYQPLRH